MAGATRVYSYLNNPNLLAGYLLPAMSFSAMAAFAWPKWLPKLLAVVTYGVNECLPNPDVKSRWLAGLFGCILCDDCIAGILVESPFP